MKRILEYALLALLVTVCASLAEPLFNVSFNITAAPTGTTASVDTKTAIMGTVRYFSFVAGTNVNISVATVDGHGASLGGARSVFSNTNSVSTNMAPASTIYLSNDRVAMSIHSAAATNITVRGVLVVEK